MKKASPVWLLVLLGLAAIAARAQSGGFQRPIAGFVFSRGTQTVCPLFGVPGSTYIGSPVLRDVDAASIAPGGEWGIVIRNGMARAVRSLSDNPVESAVEGIIDAIDRVAWSSDGAFALLASAARRQVQRIRFSATGAEADAPADLAVGDVSALAIHAGDSRMAVGIAGSGLYVFLPGQTPMLVAPTRNLTAAAFDDAGGLYAVNAAERRIWQFDGDSGPTEFAVLDQPDGTSIDAAGLAVSGGGRYLLVTDKSARAVRVYDIASRTLAKTIPLDFVPVRAERLSSDPVFLLNGDTGREWLMVLDARQEPLVYFIPAAREEAL